MTMEIVRFAGLEPGPKLLVLGAVHGNETCGTEAIRATIADCRDGKLAIQRGQVTFVPVANAKAYAQGTREGDRNLNRDLHEYIPPQCHEDRVANILCPLLREHDVLLDIHSFSGTGEPFVFVGPSNNTGAIEPFRWAAEEGAFAACLGPSLLMHGFLAAHVRAQQDLARRGLAGTSWSKGVGTTEYMRQSGGFAVTIECGQHRDSRALEVAQRAILNALGHLGVIDTPAPVPSARRAIEVIDAVYALSEDDRLEQPFVSGDTVKKGDVIARRSTGEILTAPRDGFVIFPQATPKPLVEFYYFGVASARFQHLQED